MRMLRNLSLCKEECKNKMMFFLHIKYTVDFNTSPEFKSTATEKQQAQE